MDVRDQLEKLIRDSIKNEPEVIFVSIESDKNDK